MELVWRDGVIHCADPRFMTSGDVLDAKLRAGEVGQIFLNALDRLRDQGRATSESPQSRTYAPRLIVEAGLAGDASKGELTRAMETLFGEGRIVAGQPIIRGANRHARVGIARRTWLADLDQSAEQERASDPSDMGCAARSSVPIDRGDTLERSALAPGALQLDAGEEQERNQSAELERTPADAPLYGPGQ